MQQSNIYKYDLNAVCDFMMEEKQIAKHWQKNNLKFTFSLVDDVKHLPEIKKRYKEIKSLYKNDAMTLMLLGEYKTKKEFFYYNFLSFDLDELPFFHQSTQSLKKLLNISFKKIDDPKDDNTSGNIRLFKSIYVDLNGNEAGGYVIHNKTSEGGYSCYLSTNTDCYQFFYGSNKLEDDHRLIHVTRHELAHVLGLGHTFDQEFDSFQYTVMSYNMYANSIPTTYMLYDILTLHAYFGANQETNKGDTYYNWSSYKDCDELKCIWDAGGSDTIDVSQQEMRLIDIRDGQFSRNTRYDNISLAYTAQIENITVSNIAPTIVFLNHLDNVVNLSNGENVLYFSDYHIQTVINPNNPGQRIQQKIVKNGWGHDIIYSSIDELYDPNIFIIDVSDPKSLSFTVEGSHLQLSYKNQDKMSKDTYSSSLTVCNFRQNPNKHLFLIRTKSPVVSTECKTNYFIDEYERAQRLYQTGLINNTRVKRLTRQKIAEYDEKVAFVSGKNQIQTHEYVPLAVGVFDL